MTSSPHAAVDPGAHARIRQQEVVAELGQRALETDDIDQLMHDASVAVAETLDNEYAKVLELLPGGDVFLRQGVGWRDGLVGSATVPTDLDSQAGYTLLSEEPVIVDDLRTEDRFSGPELLTDHDVVSGISVTIGSVEDPWGVLGTHTTARREFDEHDANFVRSVANVLATAIENEQTRRDLEAMHSRISDAFYSLDENWEFTYLNDRAEELIDFTGEGLVGEHIWETFEWASDSKLRAEYERAMETQEPASFELYYPEPLETWYEINAYPDETGLSVYFRDISDRKQREAELDETIRELRESEERLRLALRAGEMGTWELDLQTEESPVRSPQHDRIFGYEEPLEDWDFETFLEHVHPDDREEVERRFAEAFETGKWEFECRITRADGERRVIAAQGRFYFDDGEPVRAVGVVQDVTDRNEREQRLERLVAQLEESNERLEQFAYAASHDLQEPLRMVSSYLQLLENRYADDLDSDAAEFLAYAVDGAERMRAMIDGLLQYSRVDTQGDPFEPVDLDIVVADVIDDLRIQIEETDAEITTASLPRVEGDASQLRQVFQTLLSNAITYSGDDPPRIHVDAERRGRKWLVTVRDEGIGIDPADQDRVFDVFQRLHSREEHAGTGIGLALCQRIIERHDGRIWVESEPDEGSTFKFTLSAVGTA